MWQDDCAGEDAQETETEWPQSPHLFPGVCGCVHADGGVKLSFH